jgi:hypothetical protein
LRIYSIRKQTKQKIEGQLRFYQYYNLKVTTNQLLLSYFIILTKYFFFLQNTRTLKWRKKNPHNKQIKYTFPQHFGSYCLASGSAVTSFGRNTTLSFVFVSLSRPTLATSHLNSSYYNLIINWWKTSSIPTENIYI